jgi:hypothetical protein
VANLISYKRVPSILKDISNGTYRMIGRAVARVLGSFDFVESVFIRRSVATREVSFGRSDIDLTIVVSSPLATPEEAGRLLELNRSYMLLRACIPILGECLIYDRRELDRAYRTDPFRASLDRRSALPVYGKPVGIPTVPIRAHNAAQSSIVWFLHYLPVAMGKRQRRNLRKFALEIWSGLHIASGDVREPYLTKDETELAWRSAGGECAPDNLGQDPAATFALCCSLAGRLHRLLLPPLTSIERPVIASGKGRSYVVVPTADYPLPTKAFRQGCFVCTPEVLDLFVHCVSAFEYAHLPPELLELGIRPPTVDEFVQTCRTYIDAGLLRSFGFGGRRTAPLTIYRLVRAIRHAVGYLERGETPQSHPQGEPEEFWMRRPSRSEYYRCWYPRLYRDAEESWRVLESLPARGS